MFPWCLDAFYSFFISHSEQSTRHESLFKRLRVFSFDHDITRLDYLYVDSAAKLG